MIAPLLLAAAVAVPAAWELEGRPISAVSVHAAAGSPPLDLVRLRSYVDLQPGEAYLESTVRHTVELLHSTGEVEDVRVSALAGETGLELVVELAGAPRLDEVAIAGDRVLSAERAQRLARLRRGDVVHAEQLDAAAQALALHLAAEGWLEARVVPSRAVTADGVRATFAVAAGGRARVRRVSVELAAGTPGAATLRAQARPRPGAVFRRAEVQRAAETMRRALVDRGHWQAHVDAREAFDPAAAAVDLVFAITPGARVTLDPTGLPEKMRSRAAQRLRDGGLSPDALDETAEWVEDALRAAGHRHPSAVARVEDDGHGLRTVRFQVEPGPRSLVASVATEGLPPDTAVALSTRSGTPLEDRTLIADAEAIRTALRLAGHADPDVEAFADETGGLTEVRFRVRPGARTRVAGLRIDVPAGIDDARPTLAPVLQLVAGAPFHAAALAHDRAAVRTAWRNAGYPDVEVVPEVSFTADQATADVVLHVAPGSAVRVARIVISGLQRTREEVVRRELAIREGDPLSFDRLVESQRRLGALGSLQRVTITELDPERPRDRTLVVAAEEAPATTVAYGVGYAERDRLRGSVEVTRRNLFGMDRSLTGFARVSFRGSRLLATYREPWLFGHRQEIFVSAFREEDDRPGFDYVRWGGVVQTGRRLGPLWSVIGRFSVQRTQTFAVEVACTEIDRQLCSSRVAGPSGSVVRDSRDDALEPRRGSFVGADVQLSHGILGGDAFLKSFLQAARYEPRGTRTLLALSARLGLARRLGGERDAQGLRLLPLPDRFFTGGDYGLRGHALDAVAPAGGNALLLLGAELRVELARRFATAVFAEAGNVTALVSDLRLGELRTTAGVGLRYRSALGPLRIDWAFKLDRRTGESPSRVHVTVGHAF